MKYHLKRDILFESNSFLSSNFCRTILNVSNKTNQASLLNKSLMTEWWTSRIENDFFKLQSLNGFIEFVQGKENIWMKLMKKTIVITRCPLVFFICLLDLFIIIFSLSLRYLYSREEMVFKFFSKKEIETIVDTLQNSYSPFE